MFEKGHKINLGRSNPLAGRKKSPRRQIQDAIRDRDIKAVLGKLMVLAKAGDREACVYIIDRVYGKPKASTDIDLTGGGEIGVGSLVKLLGMIQRSKRDALQGQIEGPAVAQDENEGEEGHSEAKQ